MNLNFQDKSSFEENGYISLQNFLRKEEFHTISEEIINEANQFYLSKNEEIKKLGGYLTGNLELLPDGKIFKLWDMMCNEEFKKKFKEIIGNDLSNFNVKCSGNIVLPNKGKQHFHTDGPIKSDKIIINLAIEEINSLNAPTEIVLGTHKKKIQYWKFYLNHFFLSKKIKVHMNPGDIIIRNNSIWHRGTKNKTKKLRILLLYVLTKKEENINFYQKINDKIMIGENQFKSNTSSQRFKELFSIYFAPLYILYRIVLSIIKK